MKIALLPSTQWRNPVLGGGTEAEYAHDISNRVKASLNNRSIECEIFSAVTSYDGWTRYKDANSEGARAAVNWGADFCLSLHSDGGYSPASHYASLMCYQEPRTSNLAASILMGFCQRMNHTYRGLQARTPGINGVAVLRIPESAGIPALLLETCWHDRDPDAQSLRNPEWRQQAAEAIAETLIEIFNLGLTGEEEEEMYAPLQLLYEGGGVYVYAANPVFRDTSFAFYADVPDDYSVDIYIHPVAGQPTKKKEGYGCGGYGNPDVKGAMNVVGTIYPDLNGVASIVIHSPHKLVGGAW